MSSATRRRGEGADIELVIIAEIELGALCRELRAQRKALGISQTELAAALGVDVATVSGWENCKRPPHAGRLFAWAAYLDVQLGIITGETE